MRRKKQQTNNRTAAIIANGAVKVTKVAVGGMVAVGALGVLGSIFRR